MRILRTVCVILVFSQVVSAFAEDALETTRRERAEHLAHMKELATSIRLLSDSRKPNSVVKLVDEPVLRYSDNTRLNHESSLWIWSTGGRPSAVLAVEYYPKDSKPGNWLIEIASLSTDRIGAQHEPELQWAAKEPGLKLQTLEATEPPAEKAVRRLAQLKELLRRFTAHEATPGEGRIELRPMISPLYRYSDTDAGILDGAIFAFANGTNPEVLVVMEASQGNKDNPWKFGLIQMTGGEVTVELNGETIWQCKEADPPAVRDSYVNAWISSEKKK